MKYECEKCGKLVESHEEDMHEDPCPEHCGGLMYDSLMLRQERDYHLRKRLSSEEEEI